MILFLCLSRTIWFPYGVNPYGIKRESGVKSGAVPATVIHPARHRPAGKRTDLLGHCSPPACGNEREGISTVESQETCQ
jgi:hypothetical protein